MSHINQLARRMMFLVYAGAIVATAAWGVKSAWAFTSVVATEVMAVRHPDVLASDPILERAMRTRPIRERPAPNRRFHRMSGGKARPTMQIRGTEADISL
ncbi:MAG: hypothetical protein ACR2M1_15130 [Gemmatimonadaceae bacterium]